MPIICWLIAFVNLFFAIIQYFAIYQHFVLHFFLPCCIINIKKRGEKMYKRLKKIRKELDMTQQEFADGIGIARGNISAYEVGKNAPSDAVISLICTKYNVNENWLRTGEGDMFVKLSYSDEIAQFVGQLMTEEDDSFKKRLVSGLAALDETGWKVLEDFLDSIQIKKD
jgi:transcriptional regulator with XRE-family HTH domain